ncbi:MAG TPA: hypothetical protein VMT63_03990 [Bacteroidales bacterium]|nr:hypothetical protein [Bacteroidales bacterium]
MKKVKVILGISWAFIGLVVIIIMFPGSGVFSEKLAGMSFMKINPRLTGGDVAYKTTMQACTLVVHKPVFDGLFGDRKSGFVQVDWRGKVAEKISDTIDFDHDMKPDFFVMINTKNDSVIFTPFNRKVKGIAISTSTSYGWTIRTGLDK